MPVRKGDTAPGFELPHKPGETIDVSGHIGRETVVLLFFPFAFSPVCTTEMCRFRDDWSRWSQLGATVLGVSIDSPFVTDKFRAEENIPFPILSDFNKEVAERYGVLHAELGPFKGVAKRAAFVIDAGGTVVYDWVTDNPKNQVEFEAIQAAVEGSVATA